MAFNFGSFAASADAPITFGKRDLAAGRYTFRLDEIANGADVCFHAAGGSGLGLIEACNEKGVYSIGVNIDQSHLAPDTVLTSALTRGDVAIQMFVKSYLDGAVLTGHTTLNCANGGVGLVESSFFTDDDKAAIADVTAKIISGEIKVTNVMDY